MNLKTVVQNNVIHVCKDQDMTVCGIYYDGMKVTLLSCESELIRYTNNSYISDDLCKGCLVWEFITEWE